MPAATKIDIQKHLIFYSSVALAAVILLCLWLVFHPNSPLLPKNHYHIAFKEIGYLKKNDKVEVNGLPKGYVQNFNLTDSCVWAEIAVLKQVKIPKDSKIHVANAGIMGERIVNIVLGQSKEYYNHHDRITGMFDIGGTEIGAITVELLQEASQVLESVNNITDSLASDKQIKNYKNLKNKAVRIGGKLSELGNKSADSLEMLFDELTTAKSSIQNIIDHVSPQIDQALEQVPNMEKQFSALEESLTNLKNAANSIADKMNEDNTLALAFDNEGDTRKLMNKLAKDADNLLNKIRDQGLDLNITVFK